MSSLERKCRFCGAQLHATFVDLGVAPLSNAFINPDSATQMEPFYPLDVRVCEDCFLVQLEQFETPERIFGDYAYFSSFSQTWLKHAHAYADAVIPRLHLDRSSLVMELASNDGYLLQFFLIALEQLSACYHK